MAKLHCTYCKLTASPPRKGEAHLPFLSDLRSEDIDIPVTSDGPTDGALTAAADEYAVILYAEDDCWVSVGTAPDPSAQAADGSYNRIFVPSGTTREGWVSTGDKVAVIEKQ